MRSRRHSGLTLVEIIVAASLSTLLLLMVAAWFSLGSRQFRSASQASFFGRNATLAAHAIRRDLKETPLLFIRTYDNGFHFPTARDSDSQVRRTERGDPLWQGHLFYCIDKGKEPTGKLIRWFKSKPSLVPTTAGISPFPVQGDKKRIVIPGVVRPKASEDSKWPPVEEAGGLNPKRGGLELNFVRSNGTLSRYNPSQVSSGTNLTPVPSGANTGLVDVNLAILSKGAKGRPNYLEWSFRVRPLR